MKARPILFSAPMIQALLEGRKTQTRRTVKYKKQNFNDWVFSHLYTKPDNFLQIALKKAALIYSFACPYGKPGDLLWVREGLRIFNTIHTETGEQGLAAYYAEGGGNMQTWVWNGRSDVTGIPSIHMPRSVSRLTLEITDIRVERLEDISDEDAKAEGIERQIVIIDTHCAGGHHSEVTATRFFYDGCREEGYETAVDAYAALWESINGAGSWASNLWVWCISFKVHQQNIDALLKARGEAA